ncbi:hypothetical protein Ait01nite_060160 [Actinoplanes italicus]|uniref:hypothetical protein n=1 Tax=Actinoplanes italicus TaxID=113567 RepID=UPI000D04C6B4|nr:hypothetical protein [Actinoplanes italicus]GIE32971.1 hypothetical protein Ait01nite_060160 [Actinoplanes italicus]
MRRGGAAWHYDDNEVVKAKHRTYGQFRGYKTVRTFTGDGANDPRTQSDTSFHRGMSKNNDTVVQVTDSLNGEHEDHDELAGRTLETITYQGENGPADSSAITAYWISAATATRARSGLTAMTANRIAPALTVSKRVTSSGSPARPGRRKLPRRVMAVADRTARTDRGVTAEPGSPPSPSPLRRPARGSLSAAIGLVVLAHAGIVRLLSTARPGRVRGGGDAPYGSHPTGPG